MDGLEELFKQAYIQGLKDGRNGNSIATHKMMGRKQLANEVLNVSVDTADKYYLYQPGFPFYKQGKIRMYYEPAVRKWLMNHQNLN